MTTQTPQKTIEEILARSGLIFKAAQDIPGLLADPSRYRSFLEKIPERIPSNQLKIAVAGVIKSGKSTFVNAFLGKDS
nr:hypothetical protein [Desulfobacula sp.]